MNRKRFFILALLGIASTSVCFALEMFYFQPLDEAEAMQAAEQKAVRFTSSVPEPELLAAQDAVVQEPEVIQSQPEVVQETKVMPEIKVAEAKITEEKNAEVKVVAAKIEKIESPEPVVEVAPVREEKKVIIIEEEKFKEAEAFKINLSPYLFFSNLVGNDKTSNTNGKIASGPNFGLALAVEHLWSDTFSTEFFGSWSKIFANQAQTSTISASETSLGRAGVGGRFKIGENSFIGPRVSYGQELLYRSLTVDTYRLEPMGAVSYGGAAGFHLYGKKSLHLKLEAEGGAISPIRTSPYSTKTGNYWEVKPVVQFRKKRLTYSSNIFYGERTLPSSVVSFKRTDFGMGIVFSWSFGDGEE